MAENRLMASLSKHTIGSGYRNRFLSPLFGQITVGLMAIYADSTSLYRQIFVLMASAFSHCFYALMQRRGYCHSYLSTQ